MPRIVSNNQQVVLSGCLAGLGIASLSSLDVTDQVNAGSLVRVLPEWDTLSYDIWAMTPQRDAQPSKVRHAIRALQDYLENVPGVRKL